jgi:hypothetical protein
MAFDDPCRRTGRGSSRGDYPRAAEVAECLPIEASIAAGNPTGSDSPWYAIDYGLAGRGALKAKKTMIRRVDAVPLFD